MPTQELDPTQPLPALEPAPSRRRGPLGVLLRRLLLLPLLLAAPVAAALVLTPARQTVLILGSDARPDELRRGEAGRTDTLMLLVADRATPRLATISVPRDLWVPIPGHGEERINAAYELGGGQAARQTVASLLQLPVDHYALIGLQGVRDVVDAVGGIDLWVERPIHDAEYPTDDYGVMEIDIPAGRQHMDGETALRYARTRHQDNDFGRAARQQQVLAAVRTALMNPLTWPRLPAVAGAVQRSVTTDLGPLDAVALAAAFLRQPGEPDRLVIDTALARPTTGQGGAYLLEPKPELPREVARFLGASVARVEVLNGAGVSGLARTTAERLSRRGFEVGRVGDAERRQAQTTITARPESRRVAESVAAALGLPGGGVRESPDLPAGADVRLVLGSDWRGR